MSNPLLTPTDLPAFSKIEPQYIESAIKQLIQENRETVERVVNQPHFTWENFILPLTEAGDRLSKVWSPICHTKLGRDTSCHCLWHGKILGFWTD